MRILVLISEVWNDNLHPNNNMTNWFKGMKGVELATIYASPGYPYNKCCEHYFQFTEMSMIKSLIGGNRAGHPLALTGSQEKFFNDKVETDRIYGFFRSIASEPLRLVRDIIWKVGRVNEKSLNVFINEFNPDIIFTQRMGSVKMCRLERIVKKMSNAPMVAYTGDDEYTLQQYNFSPIYWLRRLWVRYELKKNIPLYRLFYSQSNAQMDDFRRLFGSNMKFLVKCGDFDLAKVHNRIGKPIVITYAGKLYCNRWKTLALLVKVISKFNKTKANIILNIYTRDKISVKQNQLLNDCYNSCIKGGVSVPELQKVYEQSDILLHVESFDKKNSLLTKYSFSTKIMECLASGCAVMAIGKQNQAGCAYLKREDAAFVASSEQEILQIIGMILKDPDIIHQYALNAYNCGMRNHRREYIQQSLKDDFNTLISEQP